MHDKKMKGPEQVQCPSCGSYKTRQVSGRFLLRVFGGGAIFSGIVWSITIIGIFIAIPMFIIGIALLVASFFVRENGAMKCRACHYKFNRFSTEPGQEAMRRDR